MDNGWTRRQVEAALLGSSEYLTQAGQTTGFLDQLYRDALNRPIDASGQAADSAALAAGVPPAAVAGTILASDEFYHDLIADLYQNLLDRPPDPDGLATWLSACEHGVRAEAIMAAILSSAEYASRLGSAATSGTAAGMGDAGISYSPTHDQATFHDAAGDLLSLSAPGYQLQDVQALPAPAGSTAMPWGLVNFNVTGVTPHGPADVTLTLPPGAHPAAYYKTNPSNGDLIPVAGAEIHGNVVILHLSPIPK